MTGDSTSRRSNTSRLNTLASTVDAGGNHHEELMSDKLCQTNCLTRFALSDNMSDTPVMSDKFCQTDR